MEFNQIPFNKLYLSDANVRTVATSKDADKELDATIKEIGILQNLVVVPGELEGKKKGTFGVVAGGRRWRSMERLVKAKIKDKDELIACLITDSVDAALISTIENSARESMHPADKALAYLRMEQAGKTVKQIAAAFDASVAHVQRLLSIANVSPVIMSAYKAGELSQDEVQAFASVEDTTWQEDVYKALKVRGGFSAYNIKEMLRRNQIKSDHRKVKFVGLKEYKAAGGTTTKDIFESCVYLNDLDLLDELFDKKIESTKEQLREEGWAWVEVIQDYTYVPHGMFAGQLEGEVDLSQKGAADLVAEHEKLVLENEKIDEEWCDVDHDDESATQALQERSEKVEARIEEVEAQIEAMRQFTPEQKAVAGATIVLGADGLKIEGGYVKKEDRAKAFKTDGAEREKPLAPTEESDGDSVTISNALSSDLREYRRQALHAHMTSQTDLMHDMMAFVMLYPAFLEMGERLQECYEVRGISTLSINHEAVNAPGAESTQAADIIGKAVAELNLSWLNSGGTVIDQFDLFRKLPAKAKAELITVVMALSLKGHGSDLMRHIEQLSEFNAGDYWSPTAATFYSRVPKGALLKLLPETMTDDEVSALKKMKKDELAAALESSEKMAGWLPEHMK